MFERIRSGVHGLDELIEGGYSRGDIILLAGGTSTGKTIFSVQFIYNGAVKHGEKGVYATFEEDRKILNSLFKLNLSKLKS